MTYTNKLIRGNDRDLPALTRYELLAENMPSVLSRLRPIDATSNGILRYFVTRDSKATRLDAARRARS